MSSDPQALLVYKWESARIEPIARGHLDRAGAASLVASAAVFCGIPIPAIRTVNETGTICRAIPKTWTIELAGFGRQPTTILHEVAHLGCIREQMARGEREGHGPIFVRTAIDLYAYFFDEPAEPMIASARQVGIRVAEEPIPVIAARLGSIRARA